MLTLYYRELKKGLVNSNLMRIRKGSVVTLLQILSRYLPCVAEENCKCPQQGQAVSCPRFKVEPPNHKLRIITTPS